MSKKRLAPGVLGLGVLMGLTACGQPAPTSSSGEPQAPPRGYSVQQYYNVAPGTGTSMGTGTGTSVGTRTRTTRRRSRGFLWRYFGGGMVPIVSTTTMQAACTNAVAQYNQCVSGTGSSAECSDMLTNITNVCQQNVGDYSPY